MAKDLELKVVAKKDSVQLAELAAEFEALNKTVDDNSKSLQKNASFSKTLDAQIEKTKKQVRDLGIEADKTGNVDVFRNLRNAEKNLAGLERLKKQLSTALDVKIDVNGDTNSRGGFLANLGGSLKNLVTGAGLKGVQAGDAFGEGFSGAAKAFLTSGAGFVLLPAVAVIADEAAAVVGAGLTAGIGAGGLALGIAGAFQDPQVKQAAGSLGTTLKGTLAEAGQSFVDPVRTAILDLDQAAFEGSDQVAKAVAPLSNAVIPLEKGIEGLVSSALPGLTKGFADAEPVLEQVGKELPGLGRAIGDTVGKISSNVSENKAAIQLTFQLIDKTIEGLGTLLHTATDVFGGILTAAQPIAHFDKAVFGWLPVVGDQVHHASDQVDALNKTLNDTSTSSASAGSGAQAYTSQLGDMRSATLAAADAEARLTAQFDDQVNKLLSLENAEDAYQKGLNDLSDALSRNTLSLRGNSDDAIQNRQAIRDLIADAERARQAAIDHAGGVDASSTAIKAANDAYEVNIKKLEALGVQLGLRKTDLDAIIGEYDIDIVVKTSGTAPTHINKDGSISVGKIKGFATGGRYNPGQPIIVGEKGPELLVPDAPGRIIPNLPAPTPFVAGSAALGGGGRQQIDVNLSVSSGGGSQIEQFFATVLARMAATGALKISSRAVIPG